MKKILLLGSALPVLFLTACGDGWDTRPYDLTPYGDRTAGYGVEYVRAHMMPEKGPVLEPAVPKEEVVIIKDDEMIDDDETTDNILNSGENYFREKQRK